MLTSLVERLTSRWPVVAAHRGASDRAPENTLAAFELAVADGAEMVELDLHPTRDGHLAVIHDVTTDRTTPAARPVHELDLDRLRTLSAGVWFDPSFADERIPSLAEALEWAKDRAYLNLDTRSYCYSTTYDVESTAGRLLQDIHRAGTLDQVVIQCADHQLAAEARRQDPDCLVGITQHGRPVDVAAAGRAARALVISTDSSHLNQQVVDAYHAAGQVVMASVEMRLPGLADTAALTAQTAARLRDLGVDIVVTDHVPDTRAALGRESREEWTWQS